MSDEAGRDPYAAPREPGAPSASTPPTPQGYPGAVPGYPSPGPFPSPSPAPSPAPSAQPTYPSQPPYGQAPYGAPSPNGPQAPYGAQPPSAAPPYGGQVPPYGQPPYPGYPPQGPGSAQGYPAGYPTYGYPAYAPPRAQTDGLAVASLATSVGGVVVTAGLAGPVGVGLGIAALVRIRRSGRRGKGLAIGGIVVGALTTLAWVGLIVSVALWGSQGHWDTDISRVDPGSLSGPGTYELRQDVSPGSCLDIYPQRYDMADAEVVECGTAHGAEVVGLVTMTGPVDFDDDDNAVGPAYDTALGECESTLDSLLQDSSADVYYDVYFPDPAAWPAETAGYCVLGDDAADLVGSAVRGDLGGAATTT